MGAFDDLIPAQQKQPIPRVIQGPPREPSPQTKTQAELDAEQLEAARLENERRRREAASGADDPKLVESERTAAFLTTRIAQSAAEIADASQRSPSAASPNLKRELVRSIAGDTAANYLTPAQRQIIEGAQINVIDAALTLGTGAAYTPEQLEGYRKAYFPQLGDAPETIAAKRERLRGILVAARVKSGGAASQIDEALRSLGISDPAVAPAPDAAPQSRRIGNDEEITFADEARPPPDPWLENWRSTNRDAAATFNAALLDPRANEENLFALSQKLFGANANDAWRKTIRQALKEKAAGRPPAFAPGPLNDPRSVPPPEGRGKPGAAETVDAVGRGAADVVTVGLADEIAAGMDTLVNDKPYSENLYHQRGIDHYDEQNHGMARFGGQVAGALLLPTKAPEVAFNAGRTALRGGLGRAEAIVAAQKAGTRRLAGESGAYGAAYGFGSTEGDLGDRLSGAAVSGALSTLTGYGLGRLGSAFGARQETRRQANALGPSGEAARAASALDIELPRFVAGGLSAQNWGRRLEQSPFGRSQIGAATDKMIEQSASARDRIASEAGEVLEPPGFGVAAIEGANAARKSGADFASRLYTRAEKLSGDTRVPLTRAATELDNQIAELADTPGVVPEILNRLQGIRSRIDGDWSPQGIRRMRTQLSDQFIELGMRPGDASRRARLITEAAEEDMVAGLVAAGKKDAADAWQAASEQWRTHQQQTEEIFEPILGANNDKTGQEVARALENAARGNGERLASFIKAMPDENASSIRASIINQLGRSNSGKQDAAGEAFSLDTFLTHWDQIRHSRNLIFEGETLKGLNNLARVAERAKQTNRTRGHSNTGADVWAAVGTAAPGMVGVGGMASGSGTTFAAGMFTTAAAALAQNGGARLLASPKFAKRLAETPTNPRAAASYWSQPWVAKLAARDPSIASELTGFQQMFVRAANDNAKLGAAAAASDEPGQE